jgi:ecotropic viral integration site 5 protein
MAQAFIIKYNVKRMKKLEKEYTAFKSKEQEEMVELKVPRLICRILLRLHMPCKICTR